MQISFDQYAYILSQFIALIKVIYIFLALPCAINFTLETLPNELIKIYLHANDVCLSSSLKKLEFKMRRDYKSERKVKNNE